MIKNCSILLIVLFPLILIFPQDGTLHPDEVKYPIYMDKSPTLISMKMIPPTRSIGKEEEENEIPNQVRPNQNKPLMKNENFRDPVVQDKFGPLQTTATIVNFDGMGNNLGYYPPDITGDVGPNHIVQSVNSQFQIWNKSGSSLYGPANLSTLWADTGPGAWVGTNDGDPIVLYDQIADRWLISQFALPSYPNGPFYELIAISSTSNPLGTYNRYIYSFTDMPDYPKIGVWPDGYYMSANVFASGTLSFKGTYACVMERDSMLVGKTARIIKFSTTSSNADWSLLPSDADGNILPPEGAPNYFIMLGSTTTTLSTRALHVDWANTGNSTYSAISNLSVAAYDENMCNYNRNCIPQTGTTAKLDAISDRLMHRLQYRNFGSYQSIVANHTVDVGSDHAGVRWYELRNTGSGWTVYQQGTYAPDATHRWMGSVAMDGDGNIAVGYSNSSSTMNPAIKFTGRYKNDAIGTFTISEQSIVNGTGSQTGTGYRWGDYSTMTVDPNDDATFWYTNEYLSTTGTAPWKTKIASFKISSLALNSPVGGEFWLNNSVHNITWAATGVSNVKLEYTTNNGSTWNLIIASTSGTTGSYAWTLPALSYDLVKVRITDLANASLIGQSTNYFSVADYTSTLSPATGSGSNTTFTSTGITFTGNVSVSAPVSLNYYSTHIVAGTLPSGIQIVSPYFWVVTNTGTTFTNGKMTVPLSFLSGVNNSNSLRWLKRTNKGDAWTNIGGTVIGGNLLSTVAFTSFSEFAICSVDSSNFVPVSTLNLTALIEAMYISGGTQMSMTPSVTVELHDATTKALVESKTATLSTAGTGTFHFTAALNNTPYYIAIKYPNTVETWSATSQSFAAGALSYDFTTGVGQAYTDGSIPPLILHGAKYCIYSGDVNQDGFVTGDDFAGVDNDASNFDYNLINDVNGDGFVTGDDFQFIDNNASNFIQKQIPSGALVAYKSRQHSVFEYNRIRINNISKDAK
jgi:hypothetical protein